MKCYRVVGRICVKGKEGYFMEDIEAEYFLVKENGVYFYIGSTYTSQDQVAYIPTNTLVMIKEIAMV